LREHSDVRRNRFPEELNFVEFREVIQANSRREASTHRTERSRLLETVTDHRANIRRKASTHCVERSRLLQTVTGFFLFIQKICAV